MTMAVTTRDQFLQISAASPTADRGSKRMAGAYRMVREVLTRSRSLSFDDHLQDVLDHADAFREVATWMERVQKVAAHRPSLAARGIGMTPELSRALKLIETAENGYRIRLVGTDPTDSSETTLPDSRDRVADIA